MPKNPEIVLKNSQGDELTRVINRNGPILSARELMSPIEDYLAQYSQGENTPDLIATRAQSVVMMMGIAKALDIDPKQLFLFDYNIIDQDRNTSEPEKVLAYSWHTSNK